MLSLALAGKPNAGKSTFYTASTLAEVDVANYPFTTIDANRGVSHADPLSLSRPRRALRQLRGRHPLRRRRARRRGRPRSRGARGSRPREPVPRRAVDRRRHPQCVDASGGTDAEGEPVEVGEHDPVEDVHFVEEEMDQWLASIVERNWESIERQSRSPEFKLDEALVDVLAGVGAPNST